MGAQYERPSPQKIETKNLSSLEFGCKINSSSSLGGVGVSSEIETRASSPECSPGNHLNSIWEINKNDPESMLRVLKEKMQTDP